MKSTHTDSKSTTSGTSSTPFFNKGNENAFFNKAQEDSTPFFQKMPLQPSLEVGQPNDPYEQEADKIGRQVMDNFDQASSIQRKFSGLGVQPMMVQAMPIGTRISRMVQRRQQAIQAKCAECEQEGLAQPKSLGIQLSGEGSMVSPAIESQIKSQRGGGQAMDVQTKTAMESSFGADFSSVRVHTGSAAVQMSQDLNAHAFTVGSDIFFNKGRYQPQTKQGAGLLAHELTHTVQQGAAVQNKRISRHPLSRMLAKHSMAHLSSVDSATLSRKEMGQLSKMPEEEMMQQKEIFESNEQVDRVQKKDGGGSLRRCSSEPKIEKHTTVFSAPNGATSDRTTVGVGEEVNFEGNTTGNWTASDAASGTLKKQDGKKKYKWTAPKRAKIVTIKFKEGGKEDSIDMDVKEPTHYTAIKDSEIAIPTGTQGAGMILNFNFHPNTVSFGNAQFMEVSHAPSNVSGYYLPFKTIPKTSPGTLYHNTGDSFHDISTDNKIDSGKRDTAAQRGYPSPWKVGGFDWLIPNHFKLKSEGGNGKKFTDSLQSFRMSGASGETTIAKGGKSVTRTP